MPHFISLPHGNYTRADHEIDDRSEISRPKRPFLYRVWSDHRIKPRRAAGGPMDLAITSDDDKCFVLKQHPARLRYTLVALGERII